MKFSIDHMLTFGNDVEVVLAYLLRPVRNENVVVTEEIHQPSNLNSAIELSEHAQRSTYLLSTEREQLAHDSALKISDCRDVLHDLKATTLVRSPTKAPHLLE